MKDSVGDRGRGLRLPAESMRRLAHAATDALVARLEGLRDDVPWRGATRAQLEPLLREPAPETGQDALKVLERAVHDVLTEGDEVLVKVIEIDGNGKMRLSRKMAHRDQPALADTERLKNPNAANPPRD